MIRALILYYLSIKNTHGYEIQRFVQMSGMDRWTKIQSGSIYYAIGKLEKEGNITMVAEEGTGLRSRKIYAITQKGKETLHNEMKQAMNQPIANVGSMKFVVDPILDVLSMEELKSILKNHVDALRKQLEYWREWKSVKAEEAENIVSLSFDLAIHSLQDQILWHEELQKNLASYKQQSQMMTRMIQSFNADEFDEAKNVISASDQLDYAKKLRSLIQENPEMAIKDLDRLIAELKQDEKE